MAKSEKKEKPGSKAKKPGHKKSSGSDDVNTDGGGGRDTVNVPDKKKP